MIEIVGLLSRDQLLTLASTLTDDQLRVAVRAAAGPSVAALGVTTPAAVKAPAQAQAPAAAKALKVTPPAAPASEHAGAIAAAIAGLAPHGFAAGELAVVCALGPKSSAIGTGIKNAIKTGALHSAGERRFTRYGATPEIAAAKSMADRGK